MDEKKTTRKRTKKRAPAVDIPETSDVELSLPRLEKMIAALMSNLEDGDMKGKVSIGDLLKLLQLYKELTSEQIREVEVRWVDRLPREN